MDPHARRAAVTQLAADFQWLEDHCRAQPELAPHAGRLRLAAALTRNVLAPALDGGPPGPLHVAVVGGAGAGKSTVVNLLAGAVVADANPQAGFTRHPTAFPPPGGADLPATADFLGPLRRLTAASPADRDEDVYQVRRTRAAADDPLAEFTIWDCPDMTTWAAADYAARLIEVAALADVVVYVASDERYNDEVPTQFLKMLVAAGKAIVVALTKMQPADAPALIDHFKTDVLAKLTTDAIPAIPVVPVPHLSAVERAAPATVPARAALANQILALCPDPAAARARTVRNAAAFLEAAGEELLSVARQDLSAVDAWKKHVAAGRGVFEDRYRAEYLAGEPFRRFDRTKDQVLAILELPAAARYASAALAVLRMPYGYLRTAFTGLVTRPAPPAMAEQQVLDTAFAGWLDALQAESLRRTGEHPVWKALALGFAADLRPRAGEKFREAGRAFALQESDELEAAAKAIPQWLTERPGLLAAIRGGKLLADIAAAGLVLWMTWVPSWYHLLLVPLAVSLTHEFVEQIVRLTVDGVRGRARAKREALLQSQLSAPVADWLAEVPLAGGTAAERLRLVLDRVPELTRAAAAAMPAGKPA